MSAAEQRAQSVSHTGGGVSGKPIRIALVTSQPLFREGMQQVLQQMDSLILLEATTIAEGMELVKFQLADMVVIEANSIRGILPSLTPLMTACPELCVVTVSESVTASEVQCAFEVGIRGCIVKQLQAADFVRVIESIHRGGFYVPPALGAGLFRQNQRPEAPKRISHSKLTPREEQILACVARAQTNKEVARELQISEKTVKHYMTVIMEKLQVRNRVEAVLKIQKA
jgi:two-component system, NarL family, nitrate/nitrite response regulator NarL